MRTGQDPKRTIPRRAGSFSQPYAQERAESEDGEEEEFILSRRGRLRSSGPFEGGGGGFEANSETLF